MIALIITVLVIALLVVGIKCFAYYCGVRGLLYYLEVTHNDMPNTEKTVELRNMAMDRTIKDFFNRN